ncbi:preprotein translocase subunit YajC [Weissella tructae]|uniref:Preprotein translocase subunit YajC n=2 Tax=Weissella TaxID=46255 RepID=A0A075U5D3_9LACO|nr:MULTISPECIES: preprotein translocase subunit YajC [Weissella]AIG65337.1 Preprotein translocase subunit YajC [Weissella tructae]AIM62651.1 Preprotein translocase subunit YajC [Weissella ceti]AIM63986.1 Preprotein translocase subunit YajC [Weissella ceti]ELA07203.1 preprotein translocase subunit YajC [Weissella ceti NC36]QVV91718.1 preprotein translocase subunit YajC [Weissella tructae]
MSQQLLLIALLFGAMYFFLIRPQKKQQAKHQEMMSNIKPGTHIITIGGLHATIDSISEDRKTVSLDADGTFLTFEMSAIRTVVAEAPVSETVVEEEVTVVEDTEEK